jgi:hypothetical protein
VVRERRKRDATLRRNAGAVQSSIKGGKMSRIIFTVSRTIFFRLLAHAPEELQREVSEDARRAIPALCFTEDDIREKFAQEEQWEELSDRGRLERVINFKRVPPQRSLTSR